MSIGADHVYPFMTTVYSSSGGNLQVMFTVLQWSKSPDLNQIEHLWDWERDWDSHHIFSTPCWIYAIPYTETISIYGSHRAHKCVRGLNFQIFFLCLCFLFYFIALLLMSHVILSVSLSFPPLLLSVPALISLTCVNLLCLYWSVWPLCTLSGCYMLPLCLVPTFSLCFRTYFWLNSNGFVWMFDWQLVFDPCLPLFVK